MTQSLRATDAAIHSRADRRTASMLYVELRERAAQRSRGFTAGTERRSHRLTYFLPRKLRRRGDTIAMCSCSLPFANRTT